MRNGQTRQVLRTLIYIDILSSLCGLKGTAFYDSSLYFSSVLCELLCTRDYAKPTFAFITPQEEWIYVE
jgi:hypothetical protein